MTAATKPDEKKPLWPAKPRRITREETAAVREKVQRAKDRARKNRLNRGRNDWRT